jgi:hypothetical protein
MKVKAFIKKLQKCDPNAEVVTEDSEYNFYSAARIYTEKNKGVFRDTASWVSLKNKPRPKKMVLIN